MTGLVAQLISEKSNALWRGAYPKAGSAVAQRGFAFPYFYFYAYFWALSPCSTLSLSPE